MAVESLLDRINRMDFFAVLPSGFYSTVTATFCIVVPSGTRNVIEALRPIADRLGDNPVYLVFLLFAAYLVGSIIRAFRVVWAERASPPFRSGFPFSEELKKALAEIKQSKATGLDVARVPSIDNGLSGNIFNYWKDVLCLKTERGFEYY